MQSCCGRTIESTDSGRKPHRNLQNMVLYEEAIRLGYAATQSEVDALVENSKQAYATPEGKEMMDAQDAYVAELFSQAQGDIIYYTTGT